MSTDHPEEDDVAVEPVARWLRLLKLLFTVLLLAIGLLRALGTL